MIETNDFDIWRQENSVITNLLESLENKLDQYEKMEKIKKYLDSLKYSQSSSGILFDIIYIIEDYNTIINQTIQAVRSLLYQNINLRELVGNENLPKNTNKFTRYDEYPIPYDMNLYERYLNTEEMKNSQSENLFKLNYDYSDCNSKENKYNTFNENESIKLNNFAENRQENFEKERELKVPLREKLKLRAETTRVNKENKSNLYLNCKVIDSNLKDTLNGSQNEIDIIKITNEILKHINTTKLYQEYLIKKFKFNTYKDFLNNIIDYKLDYFTLEQILNEIINFDGKSNNSFKLEDSFSNFITSNNTNTNNKKPSTRSSNPIEEEKKLNCKEKCFEKVSNLYTSGYNRSSENNSIKMEKNAHIPLRNKSKIQKEENKEVSFEKLLRNYDSNIKSNKKPFLRFTRLHGQYFDNKLGNKLSPPKSRSKSK